MQLVIYICPVFIRLAGELENLKKAKILIGSSVVQAVQSLPHSIRRKDEISRLVDLVQPEKVIIKVYTKHPLLAKAYIFKYKEEVDRAVRSEGIGFIGSSNLIISGLYHKYRIEYVLYLDIKITRCKIDRQIENVKWKTE